MELSKKKFVIYNLIKLGVFIAIDVFIIIFAHYIVANALKYFIGGLMLMYGIEEILFEAIFAGKHFLHKSKNYLGFVEILLGLLLIVAPFELSNVFIIWATWSILREAFEVKEIVTELKCITPRVFSGIESLVVIVFSVIFLLDPGEHHALIHMYLLCVELIFFPLTPLMDEWIEVAYYKNKRKEKNGVQE